MIESPGQNAPRNPGYNPPKIRIKMGRLTFSDILGLIEPGTPAMNLRFIDEHSGDFNHQTNTIFSTDGEGWQEFNSLWLDIYNMNNSVTIEVHEGSAIS